MLAYILVGINITFALYDIYHSLEQSLKAEFELRNPSLFMVGWARGGEKSSWWSTMGLIGNMDGICP